MHDALGVNQPWCRASWAGLVGGVGSKFRKARRYTAHDIGRKTLPSQVFSEPIAASHTRIAFSRIASNTGARLPGEELMTCNTSAVAVCCSNASRVSVMSLAFSIDDRLGGEISHHRDIFFGVGAN
jgi:hypothetical protein